MSAEPLNSSELENIGKQICRQLPKVKIGAPRFWGVWFGKPYDGTYKVVNCKVDQEVLRLQFDGGETLSVWSPHGLVMNESAFRILDADRVRWEWFHYGRPQTPSNLRFKDFVKSPEGILATTNVDWYAADMSPHQSEAAVEIL